MRRMGRWCRENSRPSREEVEPDVNLTPSSTHGMVHPGKCVMDTEVESNVDGHKWG